MAETFFGPGPQLWPPTVPLPGLSFMQAAGGPIFGVPQAALSTQPAPFLGPPMPSAPMVVASSLPDPVQLSAARSAAAPVSSGFPTLGPLEVMTGITPQALLAAVAMRRGQQMGPTTDQEIEDFIGDALDLLSGATDVEVRCEGGRALLTGVVPNKRVKRDVGEIAWAIPSVNDVQNNVTIAARRRSRAAGRETEPAAGTGPGRKQV